MTDIKAIPTVYRGIQCRSRLEARWCALLDIAGIFFDYEPDVPVRGWVPDLLAHFGKARVLIECKPIAHVNDFLAPQAKAQRSGWSGPVMVVGGTLELGADGKPDIVARGTLACRRRACRWYPVGRCEWPPGWGPQPFGTPGDLLDAWRAAGNCSQWNAPG